ncbi:MAG: HAMP domain-containing sensor histidine kinase [Campylobacterota bacterium]|nr:HAMP domain-containing sensor histidine kinase [Campylobacterota bacterium]
MKTENEYNEILSMVTHDLKSPMTAVMGALDLMAEDDLTKDEKNECVKAARKASKTILKLVENILVMAKYEAGKEHTEYELVENLQDHIKDVCNTFKYEMKVKDINFNIHIDKNLPDVYWDIDKIHYHVLNNIISNAIKFTSYGGNISFSIVSNKDHFITIKIKDDGIGIPKDKRDSIFEKYDTHNNKKVFKGTGLGLYNAFNFVKKHLGTIKIIDGLNKKGTGFNITLPINPTNVVTKG